MNKLETSCVLYVQSDLVEHEIFEILHYLPGGTNEQIEFYDSPTVLLFSDENDAHKYATPEMIRRDFIYFKYIINVVPGPECQTKEEIVGIVREITETLWSKKISVVAASDFEHLLPHKGRREFHD